MKIKYREIKMGTKNRDKLGKINSIIEKYQKDGYVLTLRQLYYQLVIENAIPNKASEYQKLSVLLKEGRMAGIVDWDAIEDRTRQPSRPSFWSSPADGMDAIIDQYRNDRQKNQNVYIEAWVEKDALSGVLKRVTQPYGVPIVVNKGYSSASAMHDAYERFERAHNRGQNIVVLYLGDFDPSGLDMVRDIRGRTQEFIDGGHVDDMDFMIKPIALTSAQIAKYNPPENPAKRQDPRADNYIAEHGSSSWEVDALEPKVLHKLLEDNIKKLMDLSIYNEILESEKTDIQTLENLKEQL